MRTGELETQLAMDTLLERVEHDEWVRQARHVIARFCHDGSLFTAETVRQAMEYDPPAPNLMGAVFRTVAGEGWITPAGYRKSSRPDAHGRVLAVWRAAS